MSWNEVSRIHRFDDISKLQEEKLLHDAVPEQTRQANNFWLGVLESFCREKQVPLDLTKCSAEVLNDCLSKFYAGLKTKKGEKYQRTSYLCARSAIQRHLTFLKRPFDLRGDVAFRRSNQILDAVLKNNKATGACKPVQHKDAINAEDKARLQTYFADVLETDDTYKLQSFCFYNLAIHFGLRGGEVFAKLRKSDVEFRTGEDGVENIVPNSNSRIRSHTLLRGL